MKYLRLLICVLTLTTTSTIFAQKDAEVKEVVGVLSMGERTGYAISLGDNSEKETVKALKTWVSDMQKKVSIDETGKHELKVTSISIPELSENPVNIYFLMESSKNDITVTGFFEVNGAFVSSTTNPDKVKACQTIMQKFGKRIEKIAIEEKVAAAQKIVKEKNDDQTSLEKKNKQLNDQISNWNESIEKAKRELEDNEKSQQEKKNEIAEEQKKLDAIQAELKKYEKY